LGKRRRPERALFDPQALNDAKNEPLQWLLGAALKQQAEVTRGREPIIFVDPEIPWKLIRKYS